MNAKTITDSALSMGQYMNPEHANSLGNVHGGVLLKLCDECGGIVAARHARRPSVTVAIDSMTFHRPVRVGQFVSFEGHITYVGRTSMEVEVIVKAENLLTGEITHTNSAYFIYVALDENTLPTEVPNLILETDQERQRFEDGRIRQDERLARRIRAKARAAGEEV
ncbi:MAG: acyl-CoA thioesterase [Caldilineaceae bacterium]|nr:acyl-CoA thioesterase [Caldilineaceae bacterium]MBP8110545.1 acyl-CoA thioesterase [Caldilineaceae bacterium]MBP8124842.1 acyl-CoA thioesterase [Caldilineaceae bacterium]MBP9075026.1 acyl-CoA thioesterase [Caldilineaceae bacterium]